MKLAEIKKETTRIAAEHIAESWTLDWDDAARGNKTTQFFTKDDEVRCLTVEEQSGYGEELDKLIVRLAKISKCWSGIGGGFSWRDEDEEEVTAKTFWKIDEDWFTEDKDEATAILAKKRKRIRRNFEPYKIEKPLEASEALVEAMKKTAGFEKASMKNIRVVKRTVRNLRGESNSSYHVTMLNRLGNVKAEKRYPLGE